MLEAYKDIAVKSARAVDAKFCGADIIVQDVYATPSSDNYCVIELNLFRQYIFMVFLIKEKIVLQKKRFLICWGSNILKLVRGC